MSTSTSHTANNDTPFRVQMAANYLAKSNPEKYKTLIPTSLIRRFFLNISQSFLKVANWLGRGFIDRKFKALTENYLLVDGEQRTDEEVAQNKANPSTQPTDEAIRNFESDLDKWVKGQYTLARKFKSLITRSETDDDPYPEERAEAARRIREAFYSDSTSLDLSVLSLTSLPECIGSLKALTELELRFNQLRELPDWIGNLTELTTLHLSSNQLQSLPMTLARCTRLKDITVGFMRLQTGERVSSDTEASLESQRDAILEATRAT